MTDNAMANRKVSKRKTMANRKCQKEKQCSTEHYIETKDWTLQIPFKTGDDLMCSGKVSTSNSTICTRRVTHVKNLVKSSERRKDGL
jgi:hypothetical protein